MVSGPKMNPEECVICKGTRLMCGRRECPILIKQMAMLPLRRIKFTADIKGASPPSFFVGRQNYPRVLVGPMIPVVPDKNTQIFDEPDLWYGQSVTDLVRYRSSLIRTTFSMNVRNPSSRDSRLLDVAQEMVMASEPVSTEAQLSKRPEYRIDFDSLTAPMGPRGILQRLMITENPSIPTYVDRTVGDTDLKATNAISDLYANGHSVTQIQRLLSAGLLGIQKSRRLVPTRWSITATDDTVSKALIDKIKAVVNNEVITQGEIDRILYPIYLRYKEIYQNEELNQKLEEASSEILGQLIEDRLLLSESKKQGIEVIIENDAGMGAGFTNKDY